MNYYNVLHGEFAKESDRAAVILVAAIIDDLLRSCLASRFVATTSNEDALFDGANSALGNFSSRIEMSYRLGLVSPRFARESEFTASPPFSQALGKGSVFRGRILDGLLSAGYDGKKFRSRCRRHRVGL